MLNIDNQTRVNLRANAGLLVHILTDETAEPEITKLDIDAFISQLEQLKQAVEKPLSDAEVMNAGMMDWKLRLLEYIAPDDIDRDADRTILARQKSRLVDVLMSIPDANCFLALMREFLSEPDDGIMKTPRPGRSDDCRCSRRTLTKEDLESTLTFMRLPARRKYILEGKSALNEQLQGRALEYLNDRCIYIPEDFERLTPTEFLLDSGLDASVTRQVIVTRAYKEHIKPER